MASVLAGFRYLFGIHMGVSRGPVDEMVEIKVGDRTAWRGSVTANGEIDVDAYNLFGGEDGEGGVKGKLTVMMGGSTQTAPVALASVLKSPMPGFRGRFTVFFDGIMTMLNPYPKPWKFRVRRALQGWDGGTCWYPERAVISLTRPVSEAETEASMETQVVSNVEVHQPGRASELDPLVITFNPPGPLVAFDAIYTQASGDFPAERYGPESGLYTRDGNVITFDISANSYWSTAYVDVVYTYTLTTVDPGSSLGDALIQAMNPAHIIYECLTNREWGRGLPASALNEDSFRDVADRLFSEQFGICVRWNRRDSIKAFIGMMIDHIGGVLYQDRSTAKMTLKLIREDYDRNTLPLFTSETGLLEISEAAVTATGPLVNEITVTYRDPVTDEDRVVTAKNLAARLASGGIPNSLKMEFTGLPTPDLASRVAKRELRAKSLQLRRFSVTLDRRAFNLTPGGVFRIQDGPRNIKDTVVRIINIDYGNIRNGKIQVEAMQDVFGTPATGFSTIGPPIFSPLKSKPCVGEHWVFEVPYRSLYRALSAAEFDYVDPVTARLGVICAQGQPTNISYTMGVKSGAVDLGTESAVDGSYYCAITGGGASPAGGGS